MVKQKLRWLTSGCTSSIGNALAAKRNGKTCTRLSSFPTRRHILAASACGFIALIVGVALLCFTAARWLPAESVCIFPIERRAKMQSIVYVQKQQKSRTGWGGDPYQRPKRMHRNTFDRLRMQYFAVSQEAEKRSEERLIALGRRILSQSFSRELQYDGW